MSSSSYYPIRIIEYGFRFYCLESMVETKQQNEKFQRKRKDPWPNIGQGGLLPKHISLMLIKSKQNNP